MTIFFSSMPVFMVSVYLTKVEVESTSDYALGLRDVDDVLVLLDHGKRERIDRFEIYYIMQSSLEMDLGVV